jgi:hypothetical protein
MSLVNKHDMTMKCHWIQINKVKKARGEEITEVDKGDIPCWINKNSFIYVQESNNYIKVPAQQFIIYRDSTVKVGDKLNGMIVSEVNEINDFDGSIDHFEVKARA